LSEILVFVGAIAITAIIFAILSLSVNLQYGSAGLFNFGVVAFFMIGAYTSASLTLAGLPFVIGVIAGATSAAMAGFFISLPALKLRGDFLALATFMFAEIISTLVLNVQSLGGAIGIAHVPSAFPWINNYDQIVEANLALTAPLFAFFYFVYRLYMRSPYGRVLKSMKDDEMLTQSVGKDTFRYKWQVFVMGSIIAGVDGAVYVQYLGFAGTELFTYSVTFTVYIMSIIGGSTTGIGALIGSAVYTTVQNLLLLTKEEINLPLDPNNLLFILFGLATVLILYLRPDGIARQRVRRVRVKSIQS